jgi:hypothetical protein
VKCHRKIEQEETKVMRWGGVTVSNQTVKEGEPWRCDFEGEEGTTSARILRQESPTRSRDSTEYSVQNESGKGGCSEIDSEK